MLRTLSGQWGSADCYRLPVCRQLTNSRSIQSVITGDGDFGSCSCAAITLPLRFRPRLSQRFLWFCPNDVSSTHLSYYTYLLFSWNPTMMCHQIPGYVSRYRPLINQWQDDLNRLREWAELHSQTLLIGVSSPRRLTLPPFDQPQTSHVTVSWSFNDRTTWIHPESRCYHAFYDPLSVCTRLR